MGSRDIYNNNNNGKKNLVYGISEPVNFMNTNITLISFIIVEGLM